MPRPLAFVFVKVKLAWVVSVWGRISGSDLDLVILGLSGPPLRQEGQLP